MSRDRIYSVESQCHGKRPYRRRRDAKRASAQMGGGTGTYHCVWCDRFHVGHDPLRASIRRTRQ